MGLCGSSKELLLGTCNYGEPHASPLKQRKGKLKEERLGGAVTNKSIAGNWELEAQGPSLAELRQSLTAELLPGKENIFLPLNDGGKVVSHSAGDGKCIASYWGIMLSAVCMRAPPSGLPIPFP